jgi:hypothetical protein
MILVKGAHREDKRPQEAKNKLRRRGEVDMSVRRSKTKVLVDGGDPQATVRVKGPIGFVDGQSILQENWRGSPCCGVACSVTETHGSQPPILWVHYN